MNTSLFGTSMRSTLHTGVGAAAIALCLSSTVTLAQFRGDARPDLDTPSKASRSAALQKPAPRPDGLWVEYYYRLHPDLAAHFSANDTVGIAAHYARHGINEGRSPNPFFDPKFYLANYGDLRRAFGADNYAAAARHWTTHGIVEGRQGSAAFSPRYYLKKYPDVERVFGEGNYRGAYLHFVTHGAKEGRSPASTELTKDEKECIAVALGAAATIHGGAVTWPAALAMFYATYVACDVATIRDIMEKTLTQVYDLIVPPAHGADRRGEHRGEPVHVPGDRRGAAEKPHVLDFTNPDDGMIITPSAESPLLGPIP